MSNSISFTGRIGQTPELKTAGNSQVLEFSVANNIGFGDKKETLWFRCALWGKRGETLSKYLEKGSQVWISGELNIRKYTTKDGLEKTSPEIRISEIDLIGGQGDKTAPQTKKTEGQAESDDLPF